MIGLCPRNPYASGQAILARLLAVAVPGDEGYPALSPGLRHYVSRPPGCDTCSACATFFESIGVRRDNIPMVDSRGVLYKGRGEGMNPYKARFH